MDAEKLADVTGISKCFSALIRLELSEEQLAQVVELNHGYQGQFCATHEFCDSNVSMSEAFIKWFEGEKFFDGFQDYDVELWNAAWKMSMEADFKN